MLPSILALGLVAIVSARMSWRRTSGCSEERARRMASVSLGIMIVFQILHFCEELATGFHTQFGPVFGQPPMPLSIFVFFNVLCLIVWITSIPGLRKGIRFAFAASWFLGIAGVLNGIAHPLLALSQGGYFPGLYSSILVFIGGAFLTVKLYQASVPV